MRLRPTIGADRAFVSDGLFQFMNPVFSERYPGFNNWYKNKLIPGFLTDERIIFSILDKGPLGVSILKAQPRKAPGVKLSSFYIAPEIRGMGFGRQMLAATCAFVDQEHCGPVVVTVPEESLTSEAGDAFSHLLNEFLFQSIAVVPDRYRSGKKELVFRRKDLSPDR